MVLTLHDYFTICPNGGLYNFRGQSICTKEPMSLDCLTSNCDSRSFPQKAWRYLRQSVYGIAEFPECVRNYISVSEFSEKIIKPSFPNDSRFWRISNPIDIDCYPPADPAGSSIYTFIGRLSLEKGVLLLAQLKSVPQSRLRFVGAGELEPQLKKLLPQAQFFGWCDKAQIARLLDESRALLFTSLLYETQGLVVSEAMARGVPAIVPDESAARDFVRDGVTGLLFRSGSAVSLEQQILKLEMDDELVRCLGVNSYNCFWNKPPTLDRHILELVDCYREILSLRHD